MEAIDIDVNGNAYVSGLTTSTNFPTTPGAYQTALGRVGATNAFVTKLNPTGSALVYSTYLGGTNNWGTDIAIDIAGNAFVTGVAVSNDFPTTLNAFQPNFASGATSNAFMTVLNSSGSNLIYSTYLGGIGQTNGLGIAVDGSGNGYVVGSTDSTNFPTTTGAFQTSLGGAGATNAFVSKFNPLNSGVASLIYSTYLGGDLVNVGSSIAVDASGNAFVTGQTRSSIFPTTLDAFQLQLGSPTAGNAFVTKFNPTGSALIYSTYLGGSNFNVDGDKGASIEVDAFGHAHVIGYTTSPNFPITRNAFQSSLTGPKFNVFISKLSLDGTTLIYSTYLGGERGQNIGDKGNSIALDANGDVYIMGQTDSTDFPTTNGAFQEKIGGIGATNVFVTKFGLATPTVNGISPTSGPTTGGTVVTITGTGFDDVTDVFFGTIADSLFLTISDTEIVVIYSPPHAPGIVDVTVSSLGGTSVINPADQFTYIAAFPPINLGSCGRGFTNTLHWAAPQIGNEPVLYRIFRDSMTNLIGVRSSSEKLVFKDHDIKRSKTHTYYIVSVDEFGNESEPASLTIKGIKHRH